MIICESQNEARIEAVHALTNEDADVKTVTIFYREDIGKWCCEFEYFSDEEMEKIEEMEEEED